jgi:hypothetical protein
MFYTQQEIQEQLNKLIDMTHEVPDDQPVKSHPQWQAEIDRTKEMVNNCPDLDSEGWRLIQVILYAIGVDASQVN